MASSKTSRALLAVSLIAAFLSAGCGSDTDPAEDTSADTTVADTQADTQVEDTAEDGTRCCPLGVCAQGQSCVAGACLPTLGIGQCYYDGECDAGQVCNGATACGCGDIDCTPRAGSCGYPAGCCNTSGDCDGSERCIEGRCLEQPPSGECYTDSSCSAGEVCEGATSCPCGVDGCEAAPGVCGIEGVCCKTDGECGPGGVCRHGGCVEAPTSGQCYGDDDCSGSDVCHGAARCPCGADCSIATSPGVCGAAGSLCCAADSDCLGGEICVEGRGCVPSPSVLAEDDGCYVDGHCGHGRVCLGAELCECGDASCEMVAGNCWTGHQPCVDEGDCGVGLTCRIVDPLYCPGAGEPTEGLCVPEADGGCWATDECHQDLRCGEEEVCLDPQGCDEPNVKGSCLEKVLLRDCCSSHVECEEGTTCRNQNSSVTCPPNSSSVCLSVPELGVTCWNRDDCPEGLVCNRAWICGCNGKCRRSSEGSCEEPTFCQDNLDCATDELCARDTECINSPCTTTSTCDPGGQCQPIIEGLCWTHSECGDGNYCEGVRVCPPNGDCLVPDAPGECAPRRQLGECCTSHRGCDSGMRCISVAADTACILDFSSVCVPAVASNLACYADEDCGPNQHCAGSQICPCGVESCEGDPIPGTCVVD